jgi:hypothetical protein
MKERKMPTRRVTFALALATAILAAAQATIAIDVKTEFDKAFDFTHTATWGWNLKGAGDVIMARGADDDPIGMKKSAEPVIMAAVATEMERRGLRLHPDAPDVRVTYYLVLATGANAQVVGQFLPSTVAWALPPFTAQTQSLEITDHGSLVLDLSADTMIVWRGIARANIKTGEKRQRREELLREAVRDLLKKFPPKP